MMVNAIALASKHALPDYKHQPGLNARPAEDFLSASLADFPTPVTDNNWEQNLAWCFGVRLINEHFFWEAHEALEPVWMKTSPNAREQFLTQGLIQLANCALKSTMQKTSAAAKLSVLAEDCVERAYTGMNNGKLMGLEKKTLRLAITAAGRGESLPLLVLDPTAG